MSDTNKADNKRTKDKYGRKMSDVTELETIHESEEHEHCEAPDHHIQVIPNSNCDFGQLISKGEKLQESEEDEPCEAPLDHIQVESEIEVIEIFADLTSRRKIRHAKHQKCRETLGSCKNLKQSWDAVASLKSTCLRKMSDAIEGENIKEREEDDMEVEPRCLDPKIEVPDLFAGLTSIRKMSDVNDGGNIIQEPCVALLDQVESKIIKIFADIPSRRKMSDVNDGENIIHEPCAALLDQVESKIGVIEIFADVPSRPKKSDAKECDSMKESEEDKPCLDDKQVEPRCHDSKIEINEIAETDSTTCINFDMNLETVEECLNQKTTNVAVCDVAVSDVAVSVKSSQVSDVAVSVDQAAGDSTKENEKCKKGKKGKKIRSESVTNQIHLDEWYNYKQIIDQYLTKMKVSDHDKKTKSYDELCQLLLPPMTLYRERNRFYDAKREYDEPLDKYLDRLKKLSETCQFDKRLDYVVTDKFVTTLSASAFYAFCTDGQTEIDSKTALDIARKNDDGCVAFSTPYKDYIPSSLSRISIIKGLNKQVDSYLAETIRNEIMEEGLSVEWDEIAGLDFVKSVIKESIVWPLRRPDIFTGLRKLPKGMLLFGPPGNGKTMIAKCIASQSKSTFFYVSAASLTSKWYGESEKLVRALFAVAVEHQPSVIFFDEVDSLLTERNKNEHDVCRRIKTEFMTQLDGAATKDDDRVLLIGATNRPQDLDEAIRRRFVKRLYIPLPDVPARKQLLNILLKNESSNLSDSDINEIASSTNGFSSADIKWLCQDAALEPLRSVPVDRMKDIDLKDIRPLELSDFVTSLKRVRPSVSSNDLTAMIEWDQLYGSNPDRPNYLENHSMYS